MVKFPCQVLATRSAHITTPGTPIIFVIGMSGGNDIFHIMLAAATVLTFQAVFSTGCGVDGNPLAHSMAQFFFHNSLAVIANNCVGAIRLQGIRLNVTEAVGRYLVIIQGDPTPVTIAAHGGIFGIANSNFITCSQGQCQRLSGNNTGNQILLGTIMLDQQLIIVRFAGNTVIQCQRAIIFRDNPEFRSSAMCFIAGIVCIICPCKRICACILDLQRINLYRPIHHNPVAQCGNRLQLGDRLLIRIIHTTVDGCFVELVVGLCTGLCTSCRRFMELQEVNGHIAIGAGDALARFHHFPFLCSTQIVQIRQGFATNKRRIPCIAGAADRSKRSRQ